MAITISGLVASDGELNWYAREDNLQNTANALSPTANTGLGFQAGHWQTGSSLIVGPQCRSRKAMSQLPLRLHSRRINTASGAER